MVSVMSSGTDTMADYGRIGDEEKADLSAAHDRMEKRSAQNSQNEAFANESEHTSEDGRRTIVCPNCGAEICL